MAKVFVICGHGAGDSGACGNGYQEQERVRALGKCIKELGGSEVVLGDIYRDYYKDNGISSLTMTKDYQIIELHMDSSASPEPKGAHVIINAGLTADDYDNALAKFLSDLFPGRSKTIVARDDLANPDRAASMGYSYRLVECGFISNANDISVFNCNVENIARGILGCFGIATSESTDKPIQVPETPSMPAPTNRWTDQVMEVGSLARFRGVFRVDQVLAHMDSVWCAELTGDGGNSIQAGPLTKCTADGVTTENQVFAEGDHFFCNDKFKVLNVDAGTDAVQINVGGRVIWVYAGPLDEVQ